MVTILRIHISDQFLDEHHASRSRHFKQQWDDNIVPFLQNTYPELDLKVEEIIINSITDPRMGYGPHWNTNMYPMIMAVPSHISDHMKPGSIPTTNIHIMNSDMVSGWFSDTYYCTGQYDPLDAKSVYRWLRTLSFESNTAPYITLRTICKVTAVSVFAISACYGLYKLKQRFF